MIQRVVRKLSLEESTDGKHDRRYWMSRTPEERIEAVEFLREQAGAGSIRIQKVVNIKKIETK